MKKPYLLIVTAVLYLVLTGGMSLAKDTDIEPILKLDTGGHMAKIWDLVVTNDGKYLISASDDKTIRVWDMGTRDKSIGIGLRIKEKRKILGQIGLGIEGVIYAIALSPDNKHLAVGGRMANNTIDGPAIRIYDFSTGRLKKVLKSHMNVVYDLAFSNDGRYLVSGSADKTVKVWDVRDDYKSVHTFKEHKNYVYAVRIFSYRNDYHIVSAGEDNNVFLYSFKKRRVLNSFTHSHKLNYLSISMGYIAACGKDKSIDIFDLNLNRVKTITSETKPTGLVFSPDGRLLLAGVGSLPDNCNIYDTRNNFKKITSFKKHDNLTRAVAFLDNSTVITGGGDNYDIYLWDAYTGEEKAHIAGDGNTVWSVGINGKEIAFGNNARENLHNDDIKFEKTINLDTFSISDIKDISRFRRITTRYNGYKLRHKKGGDYGYKDAVLVIKEGWRKITRIVRDAYDGYGHKTYGFTDDAVIISGGANGVLKAYNLKGKEIVDFIGHTGDVCSIATQEDWLVSGSADQTMILWDLRGIKKGKGKIYPTLNMFISKDDEWVVWSNKGYYNSSVDGDKYIGYHINYGADSEAYFYSSDKFFKTYYSPVIVENLIKLGNEEQAIAYTKLMKKVEEVAVADILPPVIRLNKPQSNYINTTEDYIKVDFTVIPQSKHRITETTILVNGRPLGGRGMDVVEKKGESNVVKDIPLSEEYNKISLIAGNRYARSEEVIIEVTREKAADEDIYKPDLYVLSIGVSEYENRDLNLKYADNDARGIVDVFKAQEGKLFNKVKCTLLLNNESTRGNILDGIDWLDRETTQKDVTVLFIAGHGLNDDKGSYYFLGHDVDLKRLRRTAVKWRDFEDIVKILPSKVILLADTCHSGGIMGVGGRSGTMNNNITKAIKELVSTGREQVIMTAATGGSYSLDKDKWKHGAFTKAILEGLGELRADYDRDSRVSIKEIDLYVTKRVKELTRGKQKPTTIIPEPLPDFPIVSS